MRSRELIALALVLAACKKSEPIGASKTGGEKAPRAAVGGVVPPLVEKEHFRIDAGPRTPCKVGQRCQARIVLSALGDYKVNEEYPFKLVADPSPGIAIDGTGTFVLDDAKTGTLTLPYTAAKAGTAKLTGAFKLSVCTSENCAIESPKIAFDVQAN